MSITSTHRTRIVADAVVSAYINDISVPAQRAIERAASPAPKRSDCTEMPARPRPSAAIRIRRWAPRRRPALQPGI